MFKNFVINGFLLALFIGHSTQAKSRLTETEFYSILDRLEALYAPEFAKQDIVLDIIGDWKNDYLLAYVDFYKNSIYYRIYISGSWARHEFSNPDVIALVACHEIGHYLGGYPKRYISKDVFFTIEAQADYFATARCLKKYFQGSDNKNIVEQMPLPAIVEESCEKSFPYPGPAFICKRSSMASLATLNIFAVNDLGLSVQAFLRLESPILDFETPSLRIAPRFSVLHPTNQCRLDTFFQGALCNKSATGGACTRKEGFSAQNGARPLCWFVR